MTIHIPISWKNLLWVIATGCVLGLAAIPLFVEPDNLKYWHVGIAVLAVSAIVCTIGQAVVQSVEEEKNTEHQHQLEVSVASISARLSRDAMNPNNEDQRTPLADEQIQNVITVANMSPQEKLEEAKDEVFMDEATKTPSADLRLRIAQDVEFRERFYLIQNGRNARFDEVRRLIAKDPILAARIIRAHLVSPQPFAAEVKQVYDLMKRPFESVSDFLFQIHLVNISDNTTTIDAIDVDAEIKGVWTPFSRLDDLSDYQLIIEKPGTEGHPLMNLDAEVRELDGLWPKIKGVPITRGIGFEGWVRYQGSMPSAELEKPIQHKIRIVDALGGIHPVVVSPSNPPERTGQIRHSPQVYARLRS